MYIDENVPNSTTTRPPTVALGAEVRWTKDRDVLLGTPGTTWIAQQWNDLVANVRTLLSAGGVTRVNGPGGDSNLLDAILSVAGGASQSVRNVRSYGATGDGVTDDTTAIQNAIDAAADATRTLFFPAGDYVVTGLTVAARQDIILDRGARILLADNSDTDVIAITADGTSIRGLGVPGQGSAPPLAPLIDGNRANQVSGNGIFVNDADDVVIEGLRVRECVERGIYMQNASRVTVKRCTVDLTTLQAIFSRAQNTRTTADLKILENHVDRSDLAANNQGGIETVCDVGGTLLRPLIAFNTVLLHTAPTGANVVAIEVFGDPNVIGSSRLARVVGNHVQGGTIGISIAAGTTDSLAGDNVIEDVDSIGLEFANCSSNAGVGNSVLGNGNTSDGIVCNNNAGPTLPTRFIAIVGNTVRNCTDRSVIVLNADSGFVTVTGNVIVSDEDNADGIFVLDCEGHVRCSGNFIDHSGSVATGQRRGFVFSNSSFCSFVGNHVINSDRPGQIVANNAAHSDFEVSDNDFNGNTNPTVQQVLQGTGTLTRVHIFQNLPADEMHYLDAQAAINVSGGPHDYAIAHPNADRIVLTFRNVSLSGTDHILIQIGTGGTPTTTGYNSVSGGQNSTAGYILEVGAAAGSVNGHMILTRVTGNNWVASHVVANVNDNTTRVGGGQISLGGVLDLVRFTVTGTDTYDAGQINAHVE